jgi:hypothetical protein
MVGVRRVPSQPGLKAGCVGGGTKLRGEGVRWRDFVPGFKPNQNVLIHF